MEFQGTETGAALFFVLLGVIAAALVALIGHFYWAWRRARGQLRSADQTIPNLASPENSAERRQH
jgi:hypothetical protein